MRNLIDVLASFFRTLVCCRSCPHRRRRAEVLAQLKAEHKEQKKSDPSQEKSGTE